MWLYILGSLVGLTGMVGAYAIGLGQHKAAVKIAVDRSDVWRDRASEWRSLYLEERTHVTQLTAKLATPLILRANGALVPFDASTAHDDAEDALDDPPTVAEADKAAWLAEQRRREREEQASLDGRVPVAISDAEATPPARLTDAEEEDDAPDAHANA